MDSKPPLFPGPENTNVDVQQQVEELALIVAPLAKHAIRSGVDFEVLEAYLKQSLVEAAFEQIKEEGGKATVLEVAIRIGMDRHDVARLSSLARNKRKS